jgi:hypothetical protein
MTIARAVERLVRQAGREAAFGPANGKDDADLYFKGLVVSSRGSGPAYSVDAKAG